MLCDPFHAFDTAITDTIESPFCRFYLPSAHWVMNSLKTGKQRHSKEMSGIDKTSRRFHRALIEYLIKIRILE